MATGEIPFEEVKTQRVFESICQQIRTRLADGELKPGDKLPAERDLAQAFKVGRSAVREALRTLEMAGVVSLQKGVKGGSFIRDGNPALVTQSLQDLMFLGRVSLRSLAEARRLINTVVIELACNRGTEEDFDAIEENIGVIEASVGASARADAGLQFFRLIAMATKNEVLLMLQDSLGEIIRWVLDKSGRKAWPELGGIRRRILKALRDRDTEAASKALNAYLSLVQAGMESQPAIAASFATSNRKPARQQAAKKRARMS